MYRQRYPDDPGMHNQGDSTRRHTYMERGQTFGDRVRSGLCGILVGIIIIPCAIALLSYNEYRAVQTARSLDEGLANVVRLRSKDVVEVDANGRLVHLVGPISCHKVLADSMHGIAVAAVKLKRHVEMYQWVESEHRQERELSNGDKEVTVSYSYDTHWRSDVIRSSQFDSPFNHKNPDSMPFQSEVYHQSDVQLGTFTLSENLVQSINQYHDLTPTVLPDNKPEMKLYQKYIYYGDDPHYPKVGDMRVSFSYSGLCKDIKLGMAQTISVMAMQDGDHLLEYQTIAGNKLEMLELGAKSPEDMIRSAHATNTILTWGLRGLGLLLSFIGYISLSALLRATVSWIPLFRELVFTGTVMFSGSMALSTSLAVIAFSWIIYRPLYAFCILALTVAIIAGPRMRGDTHPSNSRRFM